MLAEHVELFDDKIVNMLKLQADEFLRSDIQRSLQFVELIVYISTFTGNPLYRALGLLAQGNALCIGLGEYKKVLATLN